MNKFETILNSLPEKPARSRLDPYADLIRELRSLGWTYREVGRILLEKCGVRISISTIHHFVRSRRSKLSRSKSRNSEKTAVPPKGKNGLKEIASRREESTVNNGVYQRIAAFKQRPASEEQSSKLFNYDPDEPLHLPPSTGKNRSVQ